MAGRNFLFVPGPTNIPDRVMRAMMVSMEDHRSPAFPALTHEIMPGLKKLFRTEHGTPFVFPSSGTGCWEAAVTNTLSPGDRVLAARFGQFSHLWIDMCTRIGLDVQIVDCEWGTGVPLQQFADILKSDTQHQFKAVLACHNETATGVTSDIAGVREALDDAAHPALLFVDCVSSLGCIDFRFDEWGVDLAVGCTYKYGNSGPGSPAWLYVNKSIQSQVLPTIQGWFANDKQFEMGPFFEPAENIRRFQIASPSIMGIRAMQASYSMIEEAGMKAISQKAALGTELILALYDAWLAPLGFSLLTPRDHNKRGGHITVGHPDAKKIAAAMRSMTNTIPDYRTPDSIRLAIAPLPTSYTEVFDGLQRMRDLVASKKYLEIQDNGSRVT